VTSHDSHNTQPHDQHPDKAEALLQHNPQTGQPGLAAGSLLDTVEDAFTVLVTGPGALTLDRSAVEGLPRRRMSLGEVRDLLLSPEADYPLRDRIWTVVVQAARLGTPQDPDSGTGDQTGNGTGDKNWRIAAVALGLPGLKRVARRLSVGLPLDQVSDLESEMLTGYLDSLHTIELSTGRIASRLCWAAYRAADRYRRRSPARSGVTFPLSGSMPPPRPWGHPDFVLARYVVDGLLSEYEAELIARTRLEGITFEELERQWRLPRATLAGDRSRAEARLVPLLRSTTTGEVTNRSRSGSGSDLTDPETDSDSAGVTRPDSAAA
jgi:hypothetical protein